MIASTTAATLRIMNISTVPELEVMDGTVGVDEEHVFLSLTGS